VDKRIETILSECDKADEREEGQPSLVEMEEELKDKKKLKSKVEETLKDLEEKGHTDQGGTGYACGV